MTRKAVLICGIAAVLVASLFAIPALASSRDSNGDRIPDRWEAKYHLSLAKDQAPRDQDKDGVKNFAAYMRDAYVDVLAQSRPPRAC